MTEMFGEAWPPMSVPDLAPDDDDLHPTDMICLSEYVPCLEVEHNWGQNTTLAHSSFYFNRFSQV